MRLKNNIEKKEIFRKDAKAKIFRIDSCKRAYNSKKVLRKLDFVLKKIDKKNVLLYIPLSFEVDLMPMIKRLKRLRKNNLYVPFMEGESFKLVKYRLPVLRKQFNIMEPPNSWARFQEIDAVVAPVIGVDGMMRRVGFGKGMYDRFFDTLSYKPIVIFVQVDKCFTQEKLCEPHDIQADVYITPTDIIIKRGVDDFRSWNKYSYRGCYRDSRVFNCKKDRCRKS
jgi:5-formyltetrahydrofolate cyclo-ligase